MDSDEIADLDLPFDANDEDSEDAASSSRAAPDFHFVGILGESGSTESTTDPESISLLCRPGLIQNPDQGTLLLLSRTLNLKENPMILVGKLHLA